MQSSCTLKNPQAVSVCGTCQNLISQSNRKIVDTEAVKASCRQLLIAIGEDPDREGLRDTPDRVARSWREFVEYDPGSIDTAFQSITVDQLVVIRGLQIHSFCEHHTLPFDCRISIGYITGNKVLGLSKFARICHKYAHKLQIQERLVEEIATELKRILEHDDIAVIGSGRHSCMYSRGIKTDGDMISSSMNGIFRKEGSARNEFLKIAGF